MQVKHFALDSTFSGCPVYWQNFIIYLQDYNDMWDRDVSMPIIQSELKKYGGRYHISEPYDHVEFDTAGQFAWFVLRWT